MILVFRRRFTECLLIGLLAAATGCLPRSEQEVIVYAALDREFSEPILNDFQAATGIQVLAKYDVESTKTVGLVSAIIQEQNRPRCDVFWNNEILHTLRLKKLGLLDVFFTPAADAFPANYRSSSGHWYGLAARARVLIVNTDLVPRDEFPHSIHDLTDAKWQGRVGIAKPLFGTTATHAAVLYSTWGEERATEFFQSVRQNAEVMSGNKQVAAAVGRGQLAFGITDTDDAIIEIDNGMPVEIVFPDQAEGELGSLFIPNSLCIIKGSQNVENARQLVTYLLSAEVEMRLAAGSSAQFPINSNVRTESRAMPEQAIRWMEVDFDRVADDWGKAAEILRKLFATVD
ncbi:MAG: extracellular solute-binding protein [Planctomycetaceae bacterium]|nr:extracellular solute-binding protein [Planctomycetaceae bacterium]